MKEEQIQEIAKVFAENGIAFFWQFSCKECGRGASALADIKFDMAYNGQDIFDIVPISGFTCNQCGNPYKINGLKMWTNHGSMCSSIEVSKSEKK